MVQATDVFIVGAGPAGLAVAARRYGLQVMVADAAAPPIDKTCGEGLLRDSLDALGRLGLVLERSDGYKLRGIQFFDGAAAPRAYFPAGQGRGLRRKTLHEKLIRHASHCGVYPVADASDGPEQRRGSCRRDPRARAVDCLSGWNEFTLTALEPPR